MPAFSILIPVYNSEKYLQECINSIINQTFQDFEIILINDGSTDNSIQICNELAAQNQYIKIFHQQNQGPLIARITAFNKASGDFVIYMDSDDCWDKQLLNDVYNTFSKFQCDIVSFKWRYMESDGNLSASIPSIYPKANTLYSIDTLITKFLTEEVENSLCKRAVRKSRVNPKHLLELSKKKELRLGEDMIQSFVMMKDCETMVYLDKALYFYRANMQSLTHQSSIQKTIIDTAIAREYLQELLLTSNFHQTKYQLMIERNFLEHYLTDLVTLSNNSNINALKNITSNIRELSIYKDAIRQIRREKLGRKRRLLYDLEQRNMWLFFWIISKIYKKLIA